MQTNGVAAAIRAAEERVERHRHQDGVGEVFGGMQWLFLAVAFFSLNRQANGDPGFLAVGLTIAAIVLLEFGIRLRDSLRQRFIYPRLGYLSDERAEPVSTVRRIIAWGLAIAIWLIFMSVDSWKINATTPGFASAIRTLMTAGAAFLGARTFYDYQRLKLPRLIVSGAAKLILGTAATLLVKPGLLTLSVFALVVGIVSIVSGTLAVASLVRSVPAAHDGAST
jgi:hypothetical protein